MTRDTVTVKDTMTWPELAITLYDMLTGRGAEVSYELVNMEVSIPNRFGEGAEYANWRFNGTLKIRTADNKKTHEAS